MVRHLVLIGGGNAHLAAISRAKEFVKKGIKVTVISPDDYHYNSAMGPGLISGTCRPQDARFNIKKLAESQGVNFIRNRALMVLPDKREIILSDNKKIYYDVASFNTGSEVSSGLFPEGADNIHQVKPVENNIRAREQIIDILKKRDASVAVIGGGPAGVEIAGSLWRLGEEAGRKLSITVVSGTRRLHRFPEKAGKIAAASLEQRGIKVIEGITVKAADQEKAVFINGDPVHFDVAFIAAGIRPSQVLKNSNVPTGKDGALLVNGFLQSVAFKEIFGCGDLVEFGPRLLDRAMAFAVRENPVILNNLKAAFGKGEMMKFRPRKNFITILDMGDDTGILIRGALVRHGKYALRLKNHIDNSFMKKYQKCGERNEE